MKKQLSVHNGHNQFCQMSLGLKNAPATFQRVVNNVPGGLTKDTCKLD